MLLEIGLALGIGIVTMILVGTVVRNTLHLRSAINWLMQTAVLFGVAYIISFSAPATILLIALPTIVHTLFYTLKKITLMKVKRGDYGDPAMWAFELFEEQDDQFIHAHTVLSDREIEDISIIADSKQELRQLMIERSNEKTK